MKFGVDKVALKQVTLRVAWISLSKHFTNAPYPSSSSYCSYETDKRWEPGSLQVKKYSSEFGSIAKKRAFIFSVFKALMLVYSVCPLLVS
jgi:hypothetical protein